MTTACCRHQKSVQRRACMQYLHSGYPTAMTYIFFFKSDLFSQKEEGSL